LSLRSPLLFGLFFDDRPKTTSSGLSWPIALDDWVEPPEILSSLIENKRVIGLRFKDFGTAVAFCSNERIALRARRLEGWQF
jgi:hypothetical protein